MLYTAFACETMQHRRFVRSSETRTFLNMVADTMPKRVTRLPAKTPLFRAQIGYDDDHDEPVAFGKERMYPRRGRAREGRLNPSGISYLYLAFDRDTAINEMRPWVGASISLGVFVVLRDLRIVDCTREAPMTELDWYFSLDTAKIGTRDEPKPTPHQLEEMIWSEINLAMSTPVERNDDLADYAPTQILAELFKDKGADGVAYRSSLRQGGRNITLFDIDAVDIVAGEVHQVTAVSYSSRQISNPWYLEPGEPGT